MSGFLDDLPRRYRVILCDLWGCVHNGVRIIPGVVERLDRWAAEGRCVIFLTNAPRPSQAVVEQLAALGLPERLNGRVVSSGDAALAWLKRGELRHAVFLGSSTDAVRLESEGLRFAPEDEADTVICSGFDERGFDLTDYVAQLERFAGRQLEMLCLNPDRVVHRGDDAEPCAGALADAYGELGGLVRYFGKPHSHIYEHAITHAERLAASRLDRSEIIAIGDSIATDFVGAANQAIDFVFVAAGIDNETYRADPEQAFECAIGLRARGARPVSVVQGLGADISEKSIYETR